MTSASPGAWSTRLSRLDEVTDPGGPVVVVSAHPDDEVLAVGGWLADQVGRELRFVVATDGEASHPGSPTTPPGVLRIRRRQELADALAVLGHPAADVTHLALRDGSLPDDGADLAARLTPLLAEAAVVLAPYEHDGHADHDVVGRVVRAVAPADAVVWRFPIWRWEWTRPTDDEWLDAGATLPVSELGRARKARAIREFTTQVAPLSDHPADAAVVPASLIDHVLTEPEVVVR